jgi:ribonucleotide monophosphatase NagD (HAD superfamily)
MNKRPKTIICDIDGTLCRHKIPTHNTKPEPLEILPGTLEKLSEWDIEGYNIILLTGRRESMRKSTEQQLADAGIFYDQLIMGVGGGVRVLINDNKPDRDLAALSINLDRNVGIGGVDIEKLLCDL